MAESDLISLGNLGDLTLQIIEYDNNIVQPADQPRIILHQQSYAVDREILRENSEHFRTLLDPKGRFQEATMDLIELKDDSVEAMEIWLRTMHQEESKDSHKVSLPTVRQLVKAADKYFFDIRELYDWFEGWYVHWRSTEQRAQDFDIFTLREMLYPTWRFNHAEGFAFITEALAYHGVGHIEEARPKDEHIQFHLPSRIIQQLNAAKGRLRTILHRDLFEVTKGLFLARCSCKEKTLFGYEKALFVIRVWPLEAEALRNSIRTILDRLENFNFVATSGSCSNCTQDYNGVVKQALKRTLNSFDGLCLDCMDKTKPKTKDEDHDYWQHNSLIPGEWDSGCRIDHGQPSWYFSFMGRKENRDRFLEKTRRQRRLSDD